MSRRARTVAIATLIVAVVVIGALFQLFAGQGTTAPADPPMADLGVFEPVRGRIVYRVGSHLEAIDPLRPNVPLVIEPGALDLGTNAMPAGFSADGSKLAVGDQEDGDLYVMDRTGTLDDIPLRALPEVWIGCCTFVNVPWLSPDGTHALFAGASRAGGENRSALYAVDLEDFSQSRLVELEPADLAQGPVHEQLMPVWSPDGTQAAFVSHDGPGLGVAIADLSSGKARKLASSWGFIRQLVWSPDGTQVLLVAMHEKQKAHLLTMRMEDPQRASLILVDVDDGEAHEIAADHFVAASWSPDGRQIAAINYPRARDVVLLNADGRGRRTLVQLDDNGRSETTRFTGVVWHPIPAP